MNNFDSLLKDRTRIMHFNYDNQAKFYDGASILNHNYFFFILNIFFILNHNVVFLHMYIWQVAILLYNLMLTIALR